MDTALPEPPSLVNPRPCIIVSSHHAPRHSCCESSSSTYMGWAISAETGFGCRKCSGDPEPNTRTGSLPSRNDGEDWISTKPIWTVSTSTIDAKLASYVLQSCLPFFVKHIMKKAEREGTSRLRIGHHGAGQDRGRQFHTHQRICAYVAWAGAGS
jgi:hypothetical protein